MNLKRARWIRLQRGQAMMEYWPTIPAAIIVMLIASLLVQVIESSFLQVAEGLNREGLDCEVESDEESEGPDTANLGCHTIQLVGKSYDEQNDRTTVAYKVTNGCDPDISHWSLEFPRGLQDKVLSVSEQYEWVVDPTTGVAGLKFDTEYGGGGGGKDKKDKKVQDTLLLVNLRREGFDDSRVVLITLAGYYNWTTTTVAIKAGQDIYYSSISAPTSLAEYEDDSEEDECEL